MEYIETVGGCEGVRLEGNSKFNRSIGGGVAIKPILYSTHCPICKMVKKLLDDKKVEYIEENDEAKMRELGITHVPVLEVHGELLNVQQAIQWIYTEKE